MALAPSLVEAFAAQIRLELYSSYLYLAMSNWCHGKGWKGFAHWLRVQHDEEHAHADKLMDYVLERGSQPVLGSLEAPPAAWESVKDVFEKVLAHEQHITERVNALYAKAAADGDPAAHIFLQWYVAEQVEEEARVQEVLDRLSFTGDRGGAILYLDHEAGKRQKSA